MISIRLSVLAGWVLVLLSLVSWPSPAPAASVGSAFTYQGSLKDAGVNPNQPYDFRFTLFDAASAGTAVSGTIVRDDLGVADGLFVTELDFGGTVYLGDQVWLQVEVRQGSSTGAYTLLPRQKLTPTPFAIGISVPHSQAFGSALPLFRMHNTLGGIGGEFSSAGLWGLRGITGGTDFNSAGVRGEAVGTAGNLIGVEGVALNSPAGTGLVGRGMGAGAYIEGTAPGATGLYSIAPGRGIFAQSTGTASAIVAHGQGTGKTNAVLHASNSGTGPAVYATGTGSTQFTAPLFSENTGTGAAFYAESRGGSKDNATIRARNIEATSGMAGYFVNNSTFATAHFLNSGTGQVLWLERPSTTAGDFIRCVTATASQFWVDHAGVTHTRVLEILGGSDLSENFDVSDTETIVPGTVVSIDPTREGKLVVSRAPYDHRVAGIVSGANGVNTGLRMGQEGSVADGDHPVALTGRVYCRATAANGPIRPGDLLTTSSVAGHAMRVDDPSRAQGAILGKAMGGLEHGEGLVLVLVGLQ